MQVLVAVFVGGLANAIILMLLRRRYDAQLFRMVAVAYVGTLSLRYVLAVYLWLNHTDPGFAMTFWGDSQTYDFFGAAIAEAWSHGNSLMSWAETVEGRVNRGFIYFVASVYYVFGRNVLLVQFINGIIGALTPIVILEIGLILYNRWVASTAMLLTAFFPQMIFWSAALYKDPAVMLSIAFNILAVFRLNQKLRLRWVLVYCLSGAALVWLRFYIFYAALAAAAAGVLMRHRRGAIWGLVSQVALVTAVILLFLFTPVGQEVLMQARYLDLQQLQSSRMDLSRADSGYGAGTDVSTIAGLLSALPSGVIYLLFAPFPWTVSGLRQALALPDVLAWYALVPALVLGIAAALKRLRDTMPILVFTSALTLAYGAFLGNVGTAYRQRTQIMMFYFLFVADGLYLRKQSKNRRSGSWDAPASGYLSSSSSSPP